MLLLPCKNVSCSKYLQYFEQLEYKVGRERHVSNFIPNMPAEGRPYSGNAFLVQKHLQNVTTNYFLLSQHLYGVVFL